MKKIIIAILATALLATGAMFVFGQTATTTEGTKAERHGKMRKGGGHRRGGKGFAFRALDLTDAQKAQMKEIRTASRAKLSPAREAMKANRSKMNAATANGAFDEAAVTAIAGEQATLSAQMIVERERVKSQMFAILTDAQKSKLAEMKAKRGEGRKARRAMKAEKVSE